MFCKNEDNESVLLQTSFQKPLCSLTLLDVPCLKQTLRDYILINIKAELHQFSEGLKSLGVLDKIQQYPSIMAPLFLDSLKESLSKGKA